MWLMFEISSFATLSEVETKVVIVKNTSLTGLFEGEKYYCNSAVRPFKLFSKLFRARELHILFL